MSDIVDAGQLEIATDEHDLGWGPPSALPGHPLVWVLIASELAVFGLALLGYAGARARDPVGFAAAQDSLDRLAGAINTAMLENIAAEAPQGLMLDPAARRRVESVRRQFEALRPRRRMLSRQSEGSEVDLDAFLRAKADRLACGYGSERLYRDARNEERDLAVAVLFDASRSTESAVNGQQVIAVAREALVALAHGLQACGDSVALGGVLDRDHIGDNQRANILAAGIGHRDDHRLSAQVFQLDRFAILIRPLRGEIIERGARKRLPRLHLHHVFMIMRARRSDGRPTETREGERKKLNAHHASPAQRKPRLSWL
jgi:uncharacterized protein (DUF58 family)